MSQIKFTRNYILNVQLQDNSILKITPPTTIEFDITKHTLSSANYCQIIIYNLNPQQLNLIRWDSFNFTSVRQISLQAGYGTNLPIVFTGYIRIASSAREGTNFLTTILAFDGGDAFINAVIPDSCTFPKGTSWQTIYKTLIGYLPNVVLGSIGPSFVSNSNGSLLVTSRSISFTGNVIEVINNLTGQAFFINNGKAYILANEECLGGPVTLINSDSGLLNTPLKENATVTFDMIFEPSIVLAQLITLDSSTYGALNNSSSMNSGVTNSWDNINSKYKITSIKHRGMISPAVCGDAITTLEFFAGTTNLTTVVSQ